MVIKELSREALPKKCLNPDNMFYYVRRTKRAQTNVS